MSGVAADKTQEQKHSGRTDARSQSPQSAMAGPYGELLALQQSVGNQAVHGLLDGSIPPAVQSVINSVGQPLEPGLRTQMESHFRQDFGQVRIHADGRAADSAEAVSAKAYTVGRDVVFGQGRFAPDTSEGKRLLAHELAHVIQQSRGGDSPTLNPHSSLEKSANAAAVAVSQGSNPPVVGGASGVGLALKEKDDLSDLESIFAGAEKGFLKAQIEEREQGTVEWKGRNLPRPASVRMAKAKAAIAQGGHVTLPPLTVLEHMRLRRRVAAGAIPIAPHSGSMRAAAGVRGGNEPGAFTLINRPESMGPDYVSGAGEYDKGIPAHVAKRQAQVEREAAKQDKGLNDEARATQQKRRNESGEVLRRLSPSRRHLVRVLEPARMHGGHFTQRLAEDMAIYGLVRPDEIVHGPLAVMAFKGSAGNTPEAVAERAMRQVALMDRLQGAMSDPAQRKAVLDKPGGHKLLQVAKAYERWQMLRDKPGADLSKVQRAAKLLQQSLGSRHESFHGESVAGIPGRGKSMVNRTPGRGEKRSDAPSTQATHHPAEALSPTAEKVSKSPGARMRKPSSKQQAENPKALEVAKSPIPKPPATGSSSAKKSQDISPHSQALRSRSNKPATYSATQRTLQKHPVPTPEVYRTRPKPGGAGATTPELRPPGTQAPALVKAPSPKPDTKTGVQGADAAPKPPAPTAQGAPDASKLSTSAAQPGKVRIIDGKATTISDTAAAKPAEPTGAGAKADQPRLRVAVQSTAPEPATKLAIVGGRIVDLDAAHAQEAEGLETQKPATKRATTPQPARPAPATQEVAPASKSQMQASQGAAVISKPSGPTTQAVGAAPKPPAASKTKTPATPTPSSPAVATPPKGGTQEPSAASDAAVDTKSKPSIKSNDQVSKIPNAALDSPNRTLVSRRAIDKEESLKSIAQKPSPIVKPAGPVSDKHPYPTERRDPAATTKSTLPSAKGSVMPNANFGHPALAPAQSQTPKVPTTLAPKAPAPTKAQATVSPMPPAPARAQTPATPTEPTTTKAKAPSTTIPPSPTKKQGPVTPPPSVPTKSGSPTQAAPKPAGSGTSKALGAASTALGAIQDYQHRKARGESTEKAVLGAAVTTAANLRGGPVAAVVNFSNNLDANLAAGQGKGEAISSALGGVGGSAIANRVAPSGPVGTAVNMINTALQVAGAPKSVTDLTQTVADVVPANFIAATATQGARAYHNILTGDTKAIDRQVKEMIEGKAGMPLEGYARSVDIAADLAYSAFSGDKNAKDVEQIFLQQKFSGGEKSVWYALGGDRVLREVKFVENLAKGQGVKEAYKDAEQQFHDSLQDDVEKWAAKEATQFFKKDLPEATGFLKQDLQRAKSGASQALGGVKAAAGHGVEDARRKGSQAVREMKQGVSDAYEGAKQQVSESVSHTGQAAKEFVTDAKDKAAQAVDQAKQVLNRGVNEARDVAAEKLAELRSAADQKGAAVKDAAKKRFASLFD